MNTKTCPICGNPFAPKRADAETCGQACRQKLYRLRHGLNVPGLRIDTDSDGNESITRVTPKPSVTRHHTAQLLDAARKAVRETEHVTAAHTKPDGTTRKVADANYNTLQAALTELIRAEQAIRALGIRTPDEEAGV